MVRRLSVFLLLLAVLSCNRGTGPVGPAPQAVTIPGADAFGAKALQFSSLSSSKTLSIEAGGEWHVYLPSSCDWLTVSPASGATPGPVELTFTVEENAGFAERKATVSFVSEGIEQKALVSIVQNKRYYVEVLLPSPVVGKNGGEFVFTVNSNAAWKYEIDDEGKAWLTEKSHDAGRLVLQAAATSRESNHGVVTFISKADEAIRTTVEVWQKDMELAIEGKELTVGQEGIELSIPVKRVNIGQWKATSLPDWVTVVAGSADVLTLRIAANPEKDRRQGTVVLGSDEDEAIRASLIVRQLGTPAPRADLADIEFLPDDSANDNAAGLTVTLKPGDVHVAMDENYGVYAPVFTHTLGATVSSGYYEFPLSNDFIAALTDDGFSMEAIVKLGVPINGSVTKPFSAHRSGGIGFALSSANANSQFLFFLGQRSGTTYVNNYVYCGFTPDPDVYYHLTGVWDKQRGAEILYIDGQQIASGPIEGDLYFGTKHFFIGGAPNDTGGTKAAAAWNGEVLYPRVYSAPLTPEQVEAAYLATRKGKYILVTD